MRPDRPAARYQRALICAAGAAVLPLLAVSLSPAAAGAASTGPDLVSGSDFLISPANLVNGEYYDQFGYTDWGLTIDGALALAATGDDTATLKQIVDYMDEAGAGDLDGTVNDWTGVGTPFVSGGDVGKEALLAEVAGRDPRAFGGWDLITQLDGSICSGASTDGSGACLAAGNYEYSYSVFAQALGVMAQMRAGDSANAQAPVLYLLSQQNADGSFPSLLPATAGDEDVDSTAMAAMALALVPGQQDAVTKALTWIAAQQQTDGGFPGASGDSTNSTGLAIQALDLASDDYSGQVAAAEVFLAGQQNSDGGFNVAAGIPGSDLRASTQALGGSVGTSFGTLSIVLPTTSPSPSTTPTRTPTPTPTASHTTTKPTPTPSKSTTTSVAVPVDDEDTQSTYTTPPEQTSPATAVTSTSAYPEDTESFTSSPLAASPSATPSRSAKTAPVARSTSLNPWWWVTIGVGVALALTVAALLTRRKRTAVHAKRGGDA